MGLVLAFPSGYSDLSDSAIAADKPALGLDLAKIYGNAAFGVARLEVFQGIYLNGDTVPLPVSPIDGYVYSRNELIYIWVPWNSGNIKTNWISAKDALWYCDWLVDQSTGDVFSDEFYIGSTQSNGANTNDGQLLVFTIGQRQKDDLVMAASASWPTVNPAWIAIDEPLQEQLIQGLNQAAKFSVVKTEAFYLGEFYNGQTVPLAVSPADGHSYSRAETKYMFSWRWTPAGNTTSLQQPPTSGGSWPTAPGYQLGPMSASVNASTGVVSTTVYYSYNGGENLTSTTNGRIAVFALCTRSTLPGSISPTADNFAQIDYDDLLPGNPLEYPELNTLLGDIQQAVLTPEFFGPTLYADGATIPLPVSPVDSYTYARSEISYIWTWQIESSGTYPPGGSDHDRLAMFFGSINQSTGVVDLTVWRLAPGGPYVNAGGGGSKISVIIVARRQAQAVTGPGVNGGSNPQSDSNTVVTDVLSLRTTQVDDLSASCNGSNTSFTLSATPKAMGFLAWNGQVRFDFTQTGTGITTSFTPDTGDKLYAFYFL